jgi:hypothetical protein
MTFKGLEKRSRTDDLLSCNRSQSYDSLRHHCRGRTRTLVLRRMPFSIIKPAPEKDPPSMFSVLVLAVVEASSTRTLSLGEGFVIRSGAERICACQRNKPWTILGCNCATEPQIPEVQGGETFSVQPISKDPQRFWFRLVRKSRLDLTHSGWVSQNEDHRESSLHGWFLKSHLLDSSCSFRAST